MGMTMTQKILAAHAGLESVTAGQLIRAKLDLVLGNDITTPVAINEFTKNGFSQVFDKDKIAIVLDHFVPNKDIKAAQQSKQCREFACSHCVSHFYDVGKMGIEHALLPEQGLVTAGDCIIGADSHTCTYGALGAFGHPLRADRRAAPYVQRQGRDSYHHRHDRRGRRAVQEHGVHGGGSQITVHGRPAVHLQHGH